MSAWISYSLARVGVFAVVFAGLVFSGVTVWVAALLAALIGLCVGYIFFRGLRDRVATDIATRRSSVRKDLDADAEDIGR